MNALSFQPEPVVSLAQQEALEKGKQMQLQDQVLDINGAPLNLKPKHATFNEKGEIVDSRDEVTLSPVSPRGETYFEKRFREIEKQIQFRSSWQNGTGYFSGVSKDIPLLDALPAGAMVKAIDQHGRRLIIIMTCVGPVTVFQRYKENCDVITSNAPTILQQMDLVPSGALSGDKLQYILGDVGCRNLGENLEELKKYSFEFMQKQIVK